jgi:hypothetical protein
MRNRTFEDEAVPLAHALARQILFMDSPVDVGNRESPGCGLITSGLQRLSDGLVGVRTPLPSVAQSYRYSHQCEFVRLHRTEQTDSSDAQVISAQVQ